MTQRVERTNELLSCATDSLVSVVMIVADSFSVDLLVAVGMYAAAAGAGAGVAVADRIPVNFHRRNKLPHREKSRSAGGEDGRNSWEGRQNECECDCVVGCT